MVDSVWKTTPRSRRHPVTATNEKIVEKIHNMVLNNSRLQVGEISKVMCISIERMRHILAMSKVFLHKVGSTFVNTEQKHVQCQISRDYLAWTEKNTPDFLRQFVTTDENWIQYYIPEKNRNRNNGSTGLSAFKERKSCSIGW